MPVAPPPPPWTAPVSPVMVERRYRAVAPYAAGGHRGLDLRARAGDPVRAPCGGRITFRGRVAGGPPTVTIDCGVLRATVRRLAPSVHRGVHVRRGATVGVATSTAVDLSARRPDGTYLDPLPLLAEASRHRVPPVAARAPRRPSRPGRVGARPANLPAGALLLPAGIGASPWLETRSGHRERSGRGETPRLDPGGHGRPAPVDWPLAGGAGLMVLAASLTGLRAARRTGRTGSRPRRLPILALVARDRR